MQAVLIFLKEALGVLALQGGLENAVISVSLTLTIDFNFKLEL